MAIHPFQDGNGRLARILTNLLLLRAGYAYVPYACLEKVVAENKRAYYASLRAWQQQVGKEGEDLSEWTLFFLKALQAQTRNLEARVEQLKQLQALHALEASILDFIRGHGQASMGQLLKLTKAKRPTLALHLRQLEKAGLIKQEGKTKGAFYRLP